MRALLQRVSEARVEVAGETVGTIGPGLLILVCAMAGDPPAAAEALATKIAKLRIFPDADGKMNRSLRDSAGAALVVSQFTLAADASRGNRPSYARAGRPDEAAPAVDRLAAALAVDGIALSRGRFGADMEVFLVNDGPVTIWLDTEA